jgi:hypothetical protein
VLLTLGLYQRGLALPYWCGCAEAKALGIFPCKGSEAVHELRPQVHEYWFDAPDVAKREADRLLEGW